MPNPAFTAAAEALAVERHENHDDCTDVETDDHGDVISCSCDGLTARHCSLWSQHLHYAADALGAAWRRQEDAAREGRRR